MRKMAEKEYFLNQTQKDIFVHVLREICKDLAEEEMCEVRDKLQYTKSLWSTIFKNDIQNEIRSVASNVHEEMQMMAAKRKFLIRTQQDIFAEICASVAQETCIDIAEEIMSEVEYKLQCSRPVQNEILEHVTRSEIR
ncbi:uncharacterized protein LOC128554704 [Mercenaria mercenaria]|uniref:uncharacterized protein LOC128554704 n=1 Tax=Mercenaria mercenaria TaxID=6596 RepID=UPI00234EFD65|nr:uncharacterized protein LOC128554704 [Mercenaria mercenaria]